MIDTGRGTPADRLSAISKRLRSPPSGRGLGLGRHPRKTVDELGGRHHGHERGREGVTSCRLSATRARPMPSRARRATGAPAGAERARAPASDGVRGSGDEVPRSRRRKEHVPQTSESHRIEIDGTATRRATSSRRRRRGSRGSSWRGTIDAGDRIIVDDDSTTSLGRRSSRPAPATVAAARKDGRRVAAEAKRPARWLSSAEGGRQGPKRPAGGGVEVPSTRVMCGGAAPTAPTAGRDRVFNLLRDACLDDRLGGDLDGSRQGRVRTHARLTLLDHQLTMPGARNSPDRFSLLLATNVSSSSKKLPRLRLLHFEAIRESEKSSDLPILRASAIVVPLLGRAPLKPATGHGAQIAQRKMPKKSVRS